jgi:hypothetical protein
VIGAAGRRGSARGQGAQPLGEPLVVLEPGGGCFQGGMQGHEVGRKPDTGLYEIQVKPV